MYFYQGAQRNLILIYILERSIQIIYTLFKKTFLFVKDFFLMAKFCLRWVLTKCSSF